MSFVIGYLFVDNVTRTMPPKQTKQEINFRRLLKQCEMISREANGRLTESQTNTLRRVPKFILCNFLLIEIYLHFLFWKLIIIEFFILELESKVFHNFEETILWIGKNTHRTEKWWLKVKIMKLFVQWQNLRFSMKFFSWSLIEQNLSAPSRENLEEYKQRLKNLERMIQKEELVLTLSFRSVVVVEWMNFVVECYFFSHNWSIVCFIWYILIDRKWMFLKVSATHNNNNNNNLQTHQQTNKSQREQHNSKYTNSNQTSRNKNN